MDFTFSNIKTEYIIPVFFGMLCSLFLSAFIGKSFGFFKITEPAAAVTETEHEEEEKEDLARLFAANEVIPDPVLEYFRNPEYSEWVIDFFTGVCSNREIAEAILNNCNIYEVPPALAFSLCWEESRFIPRAINNANRDGSVDRGLFQLNSFSFPHLEITAFYDIESNAYYGIGHLRYCLNTGGSEISALAMYNAGTGRVRSTGAPHVTLNYINRVLENRQKIESRFHSWLIKEEESRRTKTEDTD